MKKYAKTFSIAIFLILPIQTILSAINPLYITPIIIEQEVGKGSITEPYLIYSENELGKIGNDPNWTLDKHYKLMNDVVLRTGSKQKGNWSPIGSYDNPFTGTFDGNNKTISGIIIKGTNLNSVGLFAYLDDENALIKNLGLINVNIDVWYNCFVGGISGIVHSGKIENCYVTGNISGGLITGGLVGNNSGLIEKCYFNGTVQGYIWTSDVVGLITIKGVLNTNYPFNYDHKSKVGGLVGVMTNGEIKKSYSVGNVTEGYAVGAVVGVMNNSIIENCYSLANIEGGALLGGLVAGASGGKIKNSYFAGNMGGYEISHYRGFADGIFGIASNSCEIQGCVAIIGELKSLSGTIIDLFYNPWRNVNLINYYYFSGTLINDKIMISSNRKVSGITTKNATELKSKITYEAIGWHFSNPQPIWEFTGDYELPKLVDVKGQEFLVTPTHLK